MDDTVTISRVGYEGLCGSYDRLRARVAELEARIAELQPMAECAAIMAVCGYFSRMRGPDAWLTRWGDGMTNVSRERREEWFVNESDPATCVPLYAGSAPVPAAQAEADDDEATDSEVDAVVRDAERYRAVRNNLCYTAFTDSDNALIGVSVSKCWGQPYCGDRVLEFDAAADAMLGAKAKGGAK